MSIRKRLVVFLTVATLTCAPTAALAQTNPFTLLQSVVTSCTHPATGISQSEQRLACLTVVRTLATLIAQLLQKNPHSPTAITGIEDSTQSKNVNVIVESKPQSAILQFTSTVASRVSNNRWAGFGYNQDPLDRDAQGMDRDTWSSNHWTTVNERMRSLSPGMVRVNFDRDWFNPSGTIGTYTWDSPQMLSAYKVLDTYKELNVPIMTGLWHANLNQADDPTFYASQDFSTLLADLMQHLKQKGYSNITWVSPTNEPLGAPGMCFRHTHLAEWLTDNWQALHWAFCRSIRNVPDRCTQYSIGVPVCASLSMR